MRFATVLQNTLEGSLFEGTPCWIWQRSDDGKGYGHVQYDGRVRSTHKLVYEEVVGRIPIGLELDHRCRVKLCCNPLHLEPVTHGENNRRAALHRVKVEVCRNGHSYTPENTYINTKGRKVCRICKLARSREADRLIREENIRRGVSRTRSK